MTPRRITLSLLLLALALPASAQEEAPAEDVSTTAILVWGPSSAIGHEQVARDGLATRLPAGQEFPARVLRVSDWLGAARFRLGGNAVAQPCTATPPDLGDSTDDELVALSAQARAQVDELEYAAALDLFETAIARMPCQLRFVDPNTAWETWFYAGIAAFYVDKHEQAAGYFRQAAVIDPSRKWDPSYPPGPQSTFLSAVQDVLARPRGRVFGDMRGTQYVEVRLDGVSLDLTKAFETEVRPGAHLIQAVDDRGQWTTWQRQVDEGGTLTFFSALGVEQMLLDGPDGVLKNLAAADLTRRGSDEKLTDIYLVTVDPERKVVTRAFRYAPDFSLWSRLEETASGSTAKDEAAEPTAGAAQASGSDAGATARTEEPQDKLLRDPDYRATVVIGFHGKGIFRCGPKQATDGRCEDDRPRKNDYLGAMVGIDVRLVKGLALDFRFGATLSDLQEGGTILPEVAVGAKYRFLTGLLQPYVGAGADILFTFLKPNRVENGVFTVLGGVDGRYGLDLELEDGFRIGVEGNVGVIIGGKDNPDIRWPVVGGTFNIGRFMP